MPAILTMIVVVEMLARPLMVVLVQLSVKLELIVFQDVVLRWVELLKVFVPLRLFVVSSFIYRYA